MGKVAWYASFYSLRTVVNKLRKVTTTLEDFGCYLNRDLLDILLQGRMNMRNLKITVVGDGVVGKTCLLSTYVTGEFPAEYVPTVFEHYGQKLTVDGIEYDITLWDTAGQEDYERLRPLSYPGTNCFLACFCVDRNIASYTNIHLKWIPEIRHFCPHAPIILVATKADLRKDPTVKCYTTEDGKKLKRKVKAQSYKECSAKENQGLGEVIDEAVRVATKLSKNKVNNDRSCSIL